jgi:hypothetical protein
MFALFVLEQNKSKMLCYFEINAYDRRWYACRVIKFVRLASLWMHLYIYMWHYSHVYYASLQPGELAPMNVSFNYLSQKAKGDKMSFYKF